MIKICYPPGCYGSYLSRCIYNYSNLRTQELDLFQFDKFGSSHDHRDRTKDLGIIQIDHLNNKMSFDHADNTLVILPCNDHMLDYFNNVLMKANAGQPLNHLKTLFRQSDIEIKLSQGWKYVYGVNDQIPTWILREFISFWIKDCFDNGYSIKNYQEVPHKICITTQNIFLDFLNIISEIFEVFGLQVMVNESVIVDNHLKFLQAQKYHQSQFRCEQWCNDILTEKVSATPCNTIFDEVYVQYFLRKQGFEIQCDGLNVFPATSTAMIKIIYKQ